MIRAREAAAGKWESILPMVGIDRRFLDGKHHPCPANGEGEDRFRFVNRNGSGNFFCACSDGTKGGLALVMCCKGVGYSDAAREVERVAGVARPEPPRVVRDPRIALNRVRSMLGPVGFGVARYLKERGLKPAPGLRQARLNAWEDGKAVGPFDTMVGLFQRSDGKPESYHLTYLDGAGKAPLKVPRKVMTPVTGISGCAIRLYPAAPHIGIAEGIETAMAAHTIYGLPVWSVYSTAGMESFIPPDGVKRVTIFSDNDGHFAGQAAAYSCAKRLHARGVECSVELPEDKDWNDYLRRTA